MDATRTVRASFASPDAETGSYHCPICGSRLDEAGFCTNPTLNLLLISESYVNRNAAVFQQLTATWADFAEFVLAAKGLALRNELDPRSAGTLPNSCLECMMAEIGGKLTHLPSCNTGRVLAFADAFLSTVSPNPTRKETSAEPEHSTCAADEMPPRRANGPGEALDTFAEPWRVETWPGEGECNIYDQADANRLWGTMLDSGEDEALLRRVAACVNFCEGIATETLDAQKPLMDLTRDVQEQIYAARILRCKREQPVGGAV